MSSPSIKLHKRLPFRLVLVALLFVFAPLLLMYVLSLNAASKMLIGSLGDDLKEKAVIVGAEVDRFFDQRLHDAVTISQADVLEGPDVAAKAKYLSEISTGTPYLKVLRVLDSQGAVVATSGQANEVGSDFLAPHPDLASDFNEVLRASQGQTYVTDILALDKVPVIFIVAPITDAANIHLVNVLVVELDVEPLRSILAEFNASVVGQKYVYLVDNDGRVVVSANPESATGSLYPDLLVRPELLAKFSEPGEVGSTIYTDAHGDEVMAGFADMGEFGVNQAMDWSIIAVAPLRAITRPAAELRRTLQLFTIGILALVLGGLLLVSRGVLLPLRKLVRSAQRVGKGEVDVRVEVVDDDELGYLAATFNQMLDSLMSAQKGALQAQRMEAVGQLTGGIAHDFNNLMAIMVGNAELLRRQLHDDDTLRGYAEAIVEAVERGAALTGRLLAFSRQTSMAPVTADISVLVKSLHDLLQRTLGETVELKIVDSENVWCVDVDPHQLENAVINLAINARDAMPGGGVLTIEVGNVRVDEPLEGGDETVPVEDYVRVAVSDTGSGMSPEVQARAYEPFFSTKPVGKGSGLGLSMVYGFVKQTRGYIRILSELGTGTTIEFYLPRSRRALTGRAPKRDTGQPIHAKNSEWILLVEDEEGVSDVVTTMLEEAGYSLRLARNGAEAVDHLQSGQRFELLCSDMVLPGGMTGLEIAERARRIQPDIKILFTTGYADTSVPVTSLTSDAILLSKPYRRGELLRSVRQALDGTQA